MPDVEKSLASRNFDPFLGKAYRTLALIECSSCSKFWFCRIWNLINGVDAFKSVFWPLKLMKQLNTKIRDVYRSKSACFTMTSWMDW
ncbi:hypothetical protein DERF_004236 [Dermatophagoides farinae]|uniref:Uncharacterized protein n=1 Tax=Dermatophagoides farinae TaxID=6954 RepID=A0A922I2S8_DERFA|nr:hypothetical protein DERF_004236 [Dermatophagoides farinae]